MVFRVIASLSGAPLAQQIDAGGRNLAKAVTAAVAGAAEGAKLDLRRQLDAYSGPRMSRLRNAIQSKVFPNPPRYSPNAAATVGAHGEQAEKIFAAFSTGGIATAHGKALAIPLHNYRGADGKLLGPKSSFFANRLKFIPASQRDPDLMIGVLAVPATGRPSQQRKMRNTLGRAAISERIDQDLVPMFILVRAVRIPKILSPDEVMSKWIAEMPGLAQQALQTLVS